jgi:sialic acid synthase SpsE
MMDEDESLSIILSMGFPNIDEIKKALRCAKNDVNEAVSFTL